MDDASLVALLDGVGTVGLIVLFAIALARGWVVTSREHDNLLKDRDEWRSESKLKDAQLDEKDTQLRHLAEVGHTVDSIMSALRNGPRGDRS